MGNELKLSIENFQSISQGELVFHTGTTVIVGQSNSGKSATFRALKACLINPVGSQRYIKNGAKQASVTLEYNGNQIVWKRSAKENSYTINGEDYIKTGKSNAFKLLEDTGFALDHNDEVIMNIEEELQLPFPFGNTKSELFKLFENVFCISDSAIILKSAKEHEDKTKSDLVMLKNELAKNSKKLDELQSFRKELDLSKLEEMKKELQTKGGRINLLKDGLSEIKKTVKLQEVGEINTDLSITDKTVIYQDKINTKKEAIKLQKIRSVDKIKIVDVCVTDNLGTYNCLNMLRGTLGFEIPTINIVNKREDYEALKVLRDLTCIVAPVETEFTDKLKRYNELCSLKDYLSSVKKSIKQKREQIEKENERLEELDKALKAFKVCPLCHQPIEH